MERDRPGTLLVSTWIRDNTETRVGYGWFSCICNVSSPGGLINMLIFVPASSVQYGAHVLNGDLSIDERGSLVPVVPGMSSDQTREVAPLVPWRDRDGRRGAVLIARSGRLMVDGRLALPLTVLRRGSEIRIGKASLFFSDETPLQVVPFTPVVGERLPECTGATVPSSPATLSFTARFVGSCIWPRRTSRRTAGNSDRACSAGTDPHLEFSWHPTGMNDPWY